MYFFQRFVINLEMNSFSVLSLATYYCFLSRKIDVNFHLIFYIEP